MPSESVERRAARVGGSSPAPPPPQSENLPCPRCDSTNTKFCYYNNYNLSQPRHFCKSCRRYWTQGGTLRNVPVGGGTRKNSKRSRSSAANFSCSSSSTSSSTVTTHDGVNAVAVCDVGSKEVNVGENGSFTSLLSSQGHGFLALGGYGYGFEEMGFGFDKGVWPYLEVPNLVGGGGGGGVNGGAGSLASGGCDTWHMNGVVEGGLADGDCLAWPDLAISTPGNGLK